MKIKILKVYEKNNQLRVETECEFGKDNLGLGLHQSYTDPANGKPRFLKEVKRLLESKYQKNLANEKKVHAIYWKKKIDLDKI